MNCYNKRGFLMFSIHRTPLSLPTWFSSSRENSSYIHMGMNLGVYGNFNTLKINLQQSLAVDTTLTIGSRICSSIREGVYPHPQQGEYGSKQYRPNDNNCRSTVLPAQQTLQEWV